MFFSREPSAHQSNRSGEGSQLGAEAVAIVDVELVRKANALGVRYLGLCCGAMPHHIRSIAEALGRKPPASRYSADMSKHAYFGNDARLKKSNREFAGKL